MAEFHQTGKKGEELAAEHLRLEGYEILETNWHSNHREVDIIARTEEVLVIVEVKTRTSSKFGEPESFVNKAKQKHLVKAANHYLGKQRLDLEVRFDIISVVIDGAEIRLSHIPDAFSPRI
jgi:putative endonuclease